MPGLPISVRSRALHKQSRQVKHQSALASRFGSKLRHTRLNQRTASLKRTVPMIQAEGEYGIVKIFCRAILPAVSSVNARTWKPTKKAVSA